MAAHLLPHQPVSNPFFEPLFMKTHRVGKPRHDVLMPRHEDTRVSRGELGLNSGKLRGLFLRGTHRYRSKPLVASLHLKLDVLTLAEAFKIKLLETAAVEKNLLPIGRADKSKPAVPNHSFDCS